MTTPATTIQLAPAPVTTAVPLPPPAPPKRAWGAEFAQKLTGTGPSAPTPAPTMTYGRAAMLAGLDGVEIGILGLLAGALHRRGLLAPGGLPVDGILGILALAGSAPTSVHSPIAGRLLGTAGLAGIFAAAFRMGSGSPAERQATPQQTAPAAPAPGMDPILAAEKGADLL